ncbi:MAG TPA: glyoxalase, partial [Terriglobales bacterium]
MSDEARAPGIDIGRPDTSFRRIRIESNFGKISVLVTEGHLPYPYGRETTGYEVDDLDATLARARGLGVTVLVPPYISEDRRAA